MKHKQSETAKIPFNRWPSELASRYRANGYWQDLPLYELVTRHATSETIALIDGHRQFSYRQLNQLSDNLATQWQRAGLHSQQTALVQLPNCAEFFLTFLALLKIGIVPVNALYSHQSYELKAYAKQIKPSLLIADRHHLLFSDDTFIQQLQQQHPMLTHYWLLDDEQPVHNLQRAIMQSTTPFIATPTATDEVAFFQLSGGSTGTPKLIPRTHNDYAYSIRESVAICQFNAQTRYLCALPAPHNYPLSSPGTLGVFYAKGCVILALDVSPTRCFPLITQQQVNVVALVPSAAILWLTHLALANNASMIRTLQLIQLGGAFVSPVLADKIITQFRCQLQQVFGMAEGLVNYTRLSDDRQTIIGSQGRPMSDADEIVIVDDEGRPVPTGVAGQLTTRGPYTFRGYYQCPEINQQRFNAEGFYCTGDRVILDHQGYLHVVGREKDQINRGGEKIAAEEIENLLHHHPAMIQSALVSVNDALTGEKSCVFFVSHSPLKAVELRRFLRTFSIAEYKIPDHFIAISTLPLTAVGKVDKKALRQLAEQTFNDANTREVY